MSLRRSQRNRSVAKPNSTCEDNVINNNILSHRRGESDKDKTLKKLKAQELLKTSDGPQPTCVDFGPYREQKYPGYFFCSPCQKWDDRSIDNKNLNRSMTVFRKLNE